MRIRLLLFVLTITTLELTIALAQAPPAGKWMKDENNPVLGPGSPVDWDGGAVFAPSVLADEGLFKMWYTGQVASGTAVAVTAIGLATSANGTDWLRDTQNPVLVDGLSGEWDADGVSDPTVLKVDTTYHMWYAGRDETSVHRIGYATSPDGVNWTKHEANPVLEPGPEESWDKLDVRPGTVVWIDGQYYMWYTGTNAYGMTQIGYAMSPDGVNWTKHAGNPVLRAGATSMDAVGAYRPAVTVDGAMYRMWYTGAGSDDVFRIGLATSSDGVSWTRTPNNLILEPGEPGAWDASAVTQPAVVFDRENGTYRLWYAGEGTSEVQIGLATASAGYRVYLPLISRK